MKKAIKWIIISLLAVGVLATFFFLWKRQQPKTITYQTYSVQVGTIERRTIVTGKVEPRDEVAQKAQISGIVAELYKEAGQTVRAGEAIAKIKVVPDMQSLNTAESRVRLAEYNLKNVRQVFERDSALYSQKVIAREEYDKSELQYITALEELQTARDNLSIVKEGVAESSKEAGNTIVRSTISGTVLDVPVKVGTSVINTNTFNDGTTIAAVADLSDMLFVGKIDETEVGKLREGMKMDLIIGALNDQRFTATLEYISPKGTEQNGAMMFEIKGAARIPDGVQIRSGYSANAEIVLQSREQVLTLNEGAVEMRGDSAFVYVVRDTADLVTDKTAVERVPVELGMSDGMNIEIVSGLEDNDIVRGNQIIE